MRFLPLRHPFKSIQGRLAGERLVRVLLFWAVCSVDNETLYNVITRESRKRNESV